MRLVMSKDAEGDGAWAEVGRRLQGLTVTVRGNLGTVFTGEIIRSDEEEVVLDDGDRTASYSWESIKEMEYC